MAGKRRLRAAGPQRWLGGAARRGRSRKEAQGTGGGGGAAAAQALCGGWPWQQWSSARPPTKADGEGESRRVRMKRAGGWARLFSSPRGASVGEVAHR